MGTNVDPIDCVQQVVEERNVFRVGIEINAEEARASSLGKVLVWVAVMVGAVMIQSQNGRVGFAASAGAQPCVLRRIDKLLGSG